METMPDRINVTKVVTYDVPDIITKLIEQGMKNPTIDDVVEMVEEWVKDDFSCGWGHQADVRDLIFTNEDGEEL
jgi:hypothetical protein